MLPDANDILLQAVRERRAAEQKKTEFGYGIITADKYVHDMQDCVGLQQCYKLATTQRSSFGDAMLKASKTLVYSSADMALLGEPSWDVKEADSDRSEWPKNMLMRFTHVLTTPRKDRDGDVLRTEGAVVDPKMPLLWQHVHTLPIGKMVYVVEHNAKRLVVCSAIVDINDLAHDAAVMVDNGMARFSHGFRALEFAQMKETEGDTTGAPGFDVKRFEIMEESIVSVPSNVDAEVLEKTLELVEGGKLTSRVMKAVGRSLRDTAPVIVSSGWEKPEITVEIKGANHEKGTGAGVTFAAGAGAAGDEGTAAERGGDCTSGTPEKADHASSSEQGTQETADEEVILAIDEKSIDGSWEEISEELAEQAARYLLGMGVRIDSQCFVFIQATFFDSAVVTVCTGIMNDEPLSYRINWQMGDDGPQFVGEPVPVELETTTEIVERAAMSRMKAGRKISRATATVLKDCLDDMDELMKEHCTTRASKALCERCHGRIKNLLSLGIEPDDDDVGEDKGQEIQLEESTHVQLRSLITASLAMPASQRSLLINVLSTIQQAENTNETFHSIQNLVS